MANSLGRFRARRMVSLCPTRNLSKNRCARNRPTRSRRLAPNCFRQCSCINCTGGLFIEVSTPTETTLPCWLSNTFVQWRVADHPSG